MKALKYFVVSAAMFSLVACSKSDMQSPIGSGETEVVSTTGSSLATWSSVPNLGKGTDVAFAGEIKNSAISSEVVESGMVLVFGKANNQIQSLPFQENNTNLRYWYYHVSEGSVLIQASAATKNAEVSNPQDFAVVVLKADQLEQLEADGTTRDMLMGMSLEQLSTVLNK